MMCIRENPLKIHFKITSYFPFNSITEYGGFFNSFRVIVTQLKPFVTFL